MQKWFDSLPEEDREEAKGQYNQAKTFKDRLSALREWHPKGHINLKPIRTLDEYFKYIRLSTNESTWFRGESKDHGHLIPKLYRGIEEDEIEVQHIRERKYYLEFQRRARALAPAIDPNEVWSWYFLIQHYGGPTRLLDWTQDASIALFFALDSDRDSQDNPIVIVLQPMVLTEYAFTEIEEIQRFRGSVLYPGDAPTEKWITNLSSENDHPIDNMPDSPIALLPPYSDPRITAQRSCFTLFGKQIHGFIKNDKRIVCPCCGQKIIHKLVINGRKKNELRKELTRIGISSGKVYPGLDGLSKEIEDEVYNEKTLH